MGPKGLDELFFEVILRSCELRLSKEIVVSTSDPPKCAGTSFANRNVFLSASFNRFFSRLDRDDWFLDCNSFNFCSSISVDISDFAMFFSILRFLNIDASTHVKSM